MRATALGGGFATGGAALAVACEVCKLLAYRIQAMGIPINWFAVIPLLPKSCSAPLLHTSVKKFVYTFLYSKRNYHAYTIFTAAR